MSKPKTTNPNAIVRPRMLASTRDRLQELSAELSEDSYEGQRLVIEMAERAAVHLRDCQIAESVSDAVSKENRALKVKLESAQHCYAIAEDGRLNALSDVSLAESYNKRYYLGGVLSGITASSIIWLAFAKFL